MNSPVKTIRERLLLTQEELAKELGISRQMIWAYETGKSVPRFKVIKKLLEMAKNNDIHVNSEDFFN